jgi:hypothetical protein
LGARALEFRNAEGGVGDDSLADPRGVDAVPDGDDFAAGVTPADSGVGEGEPGHAAPDPEVHLVEGAGEGPDLDPAGGGLGALGVVGAELDVGGDGGPLTVDDDGSHARA